MAAFDDYAAKYQTIRLERREGVLQMTFHTENGPLQWGALPHAEFGEAFRDVAADPDNRAVILTGTGDLFSGPPGSLGALRGIDARGWDRIFREGRDLLQNLLSIEVPVIAAVNGPAYRHAEIPLLSDIVLAAEEALFQDSSHFRQGLVPGDGMHVVLPLLLGWNRGRYFLLTGQAIDAHRAQELGLVAEVLPRDRLLDRAWEIARDLAARPPLTVRYTRLLFAQQLRDLLTRYLGYGLALEGLGANALDAPSADAPGA